MKRFYGGHGKFGCHETVAHCGRSSALDVSKNGESGIHFEFLLHPFGQLVAHIASLSHNRDEEVASVIELFLKASFDGIEVVFEFGNNADLSTTGNGGCHGKVSAVASHDLHNKGAVKRIRSIADAVHVLANHIERCVYSETVIGSRNVVVDGGWDASKGDFEV